MAHLGESAKSATHILVVDDQSGFRELLKRLLEPAGYEVRTAKDAHDALASISECPPAVAILDVHMPGPNGLWLANQIRDRSPKTAMVLATSDTAVPPVESLRKGVVAYIIKPLQRDAVLAAVGDAFNWFADESKLDLSSLGVPTHVDATSQPREPDAPASARAGQAEPAASRARSRRLATQSAVIIAVVAAAAAWTLYRQRTPARAVELVVAGSGAVRVEDASGQLLMQGSGFFIAPDTFVTNHHVINGGTRAKIVMAASGRELQVRGLLAFDRQNDLALLKTSASVEAHLGLSDAVPALGDQIFVYGAPRGLAGTLSQGIVSAHRDDQNLIQISAPISPGSSGSPVVNAKGEVIGVVVGLRMDGQGLNFAVPAMHVGSLLTKASAVRPLIAAGRGAGDDVERNELIGAVKTATVFAFDEPKKTLVFDRLGRLVEVTRGNGLAKTLFDYDDLGRLKTQIDAEGDRTLKRWDFTPAGSNVVEATWNESHGRIQRRLEYSDDGVLLSDQTRIGGHVVRSTRWVYDDVAWPTATRDDDPTAATKRANAPREERDGLGNLVRQINADGSALIVEHTFDARGNWLSRERIRVDSSGTRTLVSRERRDIGYW